MDHWDSADDGALLRATRHHGQAFGIFYARHERRLLSYLMRRTGSGERAADLCAEVFAAALEACRAGGPSPDVPVAWLFGIANHKLIDSRRRAQVDNRARRVLEMRAIEVTRGQISEIERLCDEAEASSLLHGLTADQRAALRAHVVDEREYREIAADLRCSESVVRKRVSRGLEALRVRLQEGR
jgi:RNA polymerase sigma-70 factor (ECF subfamily)